MARPKAKAAEWARRVRAWRASGESADAYAERHGWNARTLTWWASQLRRSRTAKEAPGGFVQLVERREAEAPAPDGGGVGAIEVVLGREVAIRVVPGADLRLLRAVVSALGAR